METTGYRSKLDNSAAIVNEVYREVVTFVNDDETSQEVHSESSHGNFSPELRCLDLNSDSRSSRH